MTMGEQFGFKPNHDESARQAFVGAFKGYVNFKVEDQLAQVFDKEVVVHEERTGESPNDLASAESIIADHSLYHLWGTLTFHSQNLMWQSVRDTTNRTIDSQVETFRAFRDNADKSGDMSLSHELVVKAPISTTEIHRQPGGYWRENRADDIEAALNYSGTVDLYRNAKGMGTGGKVGSDTIGQFVCDVAQKYAPDLDPQTILDMGCAADVTGVDCARPFVRFAHGYAESSGLAAKFAERDAADTGYEDESFDLIVSIIMFHETTKAQVRDIMRECWRLVKPGGLVLHLDVPYQPHRMPLVKQVTNHWQVRHNGEPFWTGFSSLDMREEAIAAGFDPDTAFANYEAAGPAVYHFFGGRKPA